MRAGSRRRPMACVIGDMNLVRPLGMAGIRCAVVAAPRATVRYSRFVDKAFTWTGGWSDATELCDQLVEWAAAQPVPPVLFYQLDEHAFFVSRHRQRLASVMRFNLAPADQLKAIVDKVSFYALAARVGASIPRTIVVDPSPQLPADLNFPLLLKPSTRADARWMEVQPDAKALRVDNAAQLRAIWPRLLRFGERVVAQEIIDGPEDRLVSYHAYVDDEGAIAGEFTGRKIRTRPREFGYTTALTITGDAEVAAEGRRLMRGLQLRGVAKIDFKRGPDGRLWVLEVNPRFNLWHFPGAVAGVNLPAMVWADLAGFERPHATPRTGVEWCEVNDLRAAREWGVPLRRWLRWAIGCDAKMSLAWDDPVPVLAYAMWLVRGRGNRHDSAPSIDPVIVGTP